MTKENKNGKTEQRRILVVEDDAALSDAFNIILTKEGFHVESAFDGQEALDTLAEEKFDLILLDLLMPEVDGKEFLKRFDNKHDTPVIVFSNLDTQADIEEVQSLGATRFMLKAWATPKELVRVIEDTLEERAAA